MLVANGFPPTSYGGVEAYSFDLAKGLSERGHQVTVFCREPSAELSDYQVVEDQDSKFPVYRVVNDFKQVGIFSKLFSDPAIDSIFESFLQKVQPDVVHFNHFIALSAALPLVTARHKIPSVISLHDYWPICQRINLVNANQKPCGGPQQGGDCFTCVFSGGEPRNGLRNFAIYSIKKLLPYSVRLKLRQKIRRPGYEPLIFKASRADFSLRHRSFRQAIAACSYLSCPSEFVRGLFTKNGYADADIHILPLGVERLPKVSRATHSDKIRLAFIGTLLAVKGVDVLIKALDRVKNENIELAIYGRQDVEPNYTKYVHQLAAKDNRIHFMGPFSRERKADIYRQIDVLVVPSLTRETFSFVAREALESGIPVIASALGALVEIVREGENGFLFPGGDVEKLSVILRTISEDPARLAALDCPGNADIMTVDEHLSRLEDIYHGILNP